VVSARSRAVVLVGLAAPMIVGRIAAKSAEGEATFAEVETRSAALATRRS
jgi:hypothetical protein